jgi:hypothetical protein
MATYTGHISSSERRWVVLVSIGFVLLAFAPFLLIAPLRGADATQDFLGVVHHYQDAALYLSKIEQGADGQWLLHDQYNPEPHDNLLLHTVYALLGQLSRLISLSGVIVFHLARLAAAFFMYLAIYQLGAAIWARMRARRVFFVLAAFGSGFGWLLLLLTGSAYAPDMLIAQAFPFFAGLVNVHFPLTIMALAVIASVIVIAFRPGYEQEPAVDNLGAWAVLMSILLAFLYPESLLPLWLALGALIIWQSAEQRQIAWSGLRWSMWIVIPALPVAAYYALILLSHSAVAEVAAQRLQVPPSPLLLLVSLGIPLFIALPGIWRAVSRFEADGDRFMILWLMAMLLLLYLPTGIAQHALTGLMLPLAYFATRASEDFWFRTFLNRRNLQRRVYPLIVPVLGLSHLLVLFIPVVPLLDEAPTGATLQTSYLAAFEWLQDQTHSEDVILAAPKVSLWLPAWTGARTVYGHPVETPDATQRRRQVINWYGAETAADCRSLLGLQFAQNGVYRVNYVLIGPEERALGGATACQDRLSFLASFGDVTIYAPRPQT